MSRYIAFAAPIVGILLLAGLAGTSQASVLGSVDGDGIQAVTISPLTQDFAPLTAADPAQRRLLAGWRRDVILMDMSTEKRLVVAPGAHYMTGGALTYIEDFIATEVNQGIVFAGTDLQWDVQVTSQGATTAVVTSCDDDSQVVRQSVSTGERTALPEAVWHLAETYDLVLVSGQWTVSEFAETPIPAGQAPCGV